MGGGGGAVEVNVERACDGVLSGGGEGICHCSSRE